MGLLLKLLGGVVVVAVLAMAFLWSVLAMPYFADFRRSIVSEFLTEEIGQPVLVHGDVSVVLAPIARIQASLVEMPSEYLDDVNIAQLDGLDFDLDLLSILDGRFDLNNLSVDGLQVNLLRLEDGSTSWSESEGQTGRSDAAVEPIEPEAGDAPAPEPEPEEAGGGLLAFLKTRTVSFTSIGLLIDDAVSGFEFDFALEEFLLDQIDDGNGVGVTGHGSVNGEPFDLNGDFPRGARFTTTANFGSISLSFDGDPIPAEDGGGFVGHLAMDVAGIGELLDVLKLERVIEGSGALDMALQSKGGILSIPDFSSRIELDEGQLITLAGKVDDVSKNEGVDIALNARLYPEGRPPARAASLKELRLTDVNARILGNHRKLELEDLTLKSNTFEREFEEVGPISIGRIYRTPEGQLALQNVSLQAGPLDDPLIVASGDIRNALVLNDFDFEGQLNAPAKLLLKGLGEDAAAFGAVEAEFSVDDAQGQLSVNTFTVRAVDTEIWSLDVDATLGDVASLNGLALDLDLSVEDGATFFSALQLTPIATGPLTLNARIRGQDAVWTGKLGLGAGKSEIETTLDARKTNGRDTIKASVISETLRIEDLRNAIAGAIELRKVGDRPDATPAEAEVELQPLVLPRDKAPSQAPVETADQNLPELQPLVLPKQGGEAKIFDRERFLRNTDIHADIDFKRISGIQGVTRVTSELVSEGGKARLGPLEFNYGKGHFNFSAAMDVIEAPDMVSVSGVTAGWDLADILEMAGVDLEANGALTGNFNLTGNISSDVAFLNSMAGTVSVVMREGQVATSLLELAGLGIFPWLFSKELRQGYTDVVCIVVPVHIRAGAASFDQVVVETESVQLVARGAVDIKDETIVLRAEPRPVGRPLARSAWPFDVSGSLSKPKFKLDVGGTRSRRADGPDQMPENREPCRPDILQLQ